MAHAMQNTVLDEKTHRPIAFSPANGMVIKVWYARESGDRTTPPLLSTVSYLSRLSNWQHHNTLSPYDYRDGPSYSLFNILVFLCLTNNHTDYLPRGSSSNLPGASTPPRLSACCIKLILRFAMSRELFESFLLSSSFVCDDIATVDWFLAVVEARIEALRVEKYVGGVPRRII
ncbi:hypothetical protein BS47DRAFT_1402979 [Hydnum rufescens UP504]|uniref:Uncharacterized protein n=1 Tax=Hydnum rufescens UP504 TaxID=1448309 RepID=A0A9P6DLV6_9AGAM|nr:hypothetical protein BS47DRAFT_1402979 [Hydnum rufescens UP504]